MLHPAIGETPQTATQTHVLLSSHAPRQTQGPAWGKRWLCVSQCPFSGLLPGELPSASPLDGAKHRKERKAAVLCLLEALFAAGVAWRGGNRAPCPAVIAGGEGDGHRAGCWAPVSSQGQGPLLEKPLELGSQRQPPCPIRLRRRKHPLFPPPSTRTSMERSREFSSPLNGTHLSGAQKELFIRCRRHSACLYRPSRAPRHDRRLSS